jgi:hypothetical protein
LGCVIRLYGVKVGFGWLVGFPLVAGSVGFGADMKLITRIVGHDDPDMVRLLTQASKGKPGRPRSVKENRVDSTRGKRGNHETGPTAERLARVAPREYEAVKRGVPWVSRLGPV